MEHSVELPSYTLELHINLLNHDACLLGFLYFTVWLGASEECPLGLDPLRWLWASSFYL